MIEQTLTFDQHGHLIPYQPITTDLPTFERVFVREFGQSKTRPILFERYQEYNGRLSELLPDYTQWIGGSFVSRKLNPIDLDIVTFVDWRSYEQNKAALTEISRLRYERPKLIDGYFVIVYPEGHKKRVFYESDRIQWLFERTRTYETPHRDKGIIELLTV